MVSEQVANLSKLKHLSGFDSQSRRLLSQKRSYETHKTVFRPRDLRIRQCD